MACSRPAHTGELTGGAGSDLAIPVTPSGGHCLQPGLWQLLSVGIKGKEVGCWVLSLGPSAPSLKYWECEEVQVNSSRAGGAFFSQPETLADQKSVQELLRCAAPLPQLPPAAPSCKPLLSVALTLLLCELTCLTLS